MKGAFRKFVAGIMLGCSAALPLAATEFGVAVDGQQMPGRSAGACRPSFFFTFPADIQPHQRRLRLQSGDGQVDIDRVWSIPLGTGADHRREADIGMTSVLFAAFEIAPCRPTRWIVTIGPCHSDTCPPMGLLRGKNMGQMTIVRERTD